MRRTSLFMLVSVVAALSGQAPALAETPVSGHITSDTTWSLSGSPYVMTTSVTVDEAATLTIEPGVIVDAAPDASLNVLGVLQAVGTEADPIVFRPTDSSWLGLRFGSSGSGQSTGGDTRSALEYSEVHDVKTNSSTLPGVMLRGMAPSIAHNLFEGSFTAIYIEGPGAPLTIADNVFAFNSLGISGQSAGEVDVLRNDFWMNTTGINICCNAGGRWDIHDNDIISTAEVRSHTNLPGDLLVQADNVIDATDNWWGTTDDGEIQNRIRDGEDDPSYSTVGWDPPSSAANTEWAGHVATPTLELRRHLVAKGLVTSSDDYVGCSSGARVLVQRYQNRQWTTLSSLVTDSTGFFRTKLPDRQGRYRALLPYSLTGPPSGAYCEGGISAVRRHTHP